MDTKTFSTKGPADARTLPFGPDLLSAVVEKYDELWGKTPHKIGIRDTERAFRAAGYEFFHQYGSDVAIATRGIKPEDVVISESAFGAMAKVTDDLVVYVMPVVHDGCFTYVPIQWNLTVEDDYLTFSPLLMGRALHGEVNFWFLEQISPNFGTETLSDDDVVPLPDHPTLAYAFKDEVKSVMREHIAKLAEKYALAKEMILSPGFVAVDIDDMRELLEKVGYDADEFDLSEIKILEMAQAVAEGDIPDHLAETELQLLEKVGYDPSDFKLDEDTILKLATATVKAENLFWELDPSDTGCGCG